MVAQEALRDRDQPGFKRLVDHRVLAVDLRRGGAAVAPVEHFELGADARVERRSGNRMLDNLAESIVASAAPFGEFTPAMKKDTDQFDVTALFKFTRRGTLETTLQSDELIDNSERLLDGAQ